METKINLELKKPFRGIATIQLFDKNTGELLEEHRDENTYNARLPYLNYLRDIIMCKKPAVTSKLSPFIKQDKFAEEDFIGYYSLYTTRAIGSSGGSNSTVFQPFATLWLTNNTEAETADGYFNGTPVGLADACGADPTFGKYACTGLLNIAESYIGQDRLHLVFDFATDKCNVQFDALWLFPANYRYRGSGIETSNYAAINPFQYVQLTETPINYTFNSAYNYVHWRTIVNSNYLIVKHSDNSDDYNSGRGFSVINSKTGEAIASYVSGKSQAGRGCFYYDASTNVLFVLTDGYDNLSNLFTSTSKIISRISLDDGTNTAEKALKDAFNVTYDDFGFLESQNGSFDIVCLNTDNTAYFALRLKGKDTNLNDLYYVALYSFEPSTCTFSLISKIRLYDNPYNNSFWFVNDGLLYIPHRVNPNAKSGNTYSCINISTGKIIADNVVSIDDHFLCQKSLSYQYLIGPYLWHAYDFKLYREKMCYVTGNTTSNAKLYIADYMTSLWTTHNKLSTPVKKTDMTTMKIQYDIIWDSLSEVILPALI